MEKKSHRVSACLVCTPCWREKGLTLWVHLCQVLWEKSDKACFSRANILKHYHQGSSDPPMSNPQGDISLREDLLYWEHKGGRLPLGVPVTERRAEGENHGTIYWAGLGPSTLCCGRDGKEMSRKHWSERVNQNVVCCPSSQNTGMGNNGKHGDRANETLIPVTGHNF